MYDRNFFLRESEVCFDPAEGLSSKKGVDETQVDPNELAMGIKVEKEHTNDEKLAKEIALDHLAEIPDYYTKLAAMEKKTSVSESAKKPMKEIVNRADWQSVRQELKGKWMENPTANCRKLREFLGSIKQTEYEKLKIVMNYLTGTGFRTGRIKHACIQSLRDEVSKEMKNRRTKGVAESLYSTLSDLRDKKMVAIKEDNEFLYMELEQTEKQVLQTICEQMSLSVNSITITPDKIRKLLTGQDAIVIKFGEEQGKYNEGSSYNVQNPEGKDYGISAHVEKVIVTTIDGLERKGVDSKMINRILEAGAYPDARVDIIRLKIVK